MKGSFGELLKGYGRQLQKGSIWYCWRYKAQGGGGREEEGQTAMGRGEGRR